MRRVRLLAAGLLLAIAVAVRLSEHIPNVAPIGALALLGGAYLPLPAAWLLPLGAMAISDSIIGFDAMPITLAVYACFAISTLLGRWQRHNVFSETARGVRPTGVVGASLLSSILFYVVTNAAVWRWSGMYERTLDGLLLSYWYALPFFRNTLLGDMAYTGGLFLLVYYRHEVLAILRRGAARLCGIPRQWQHLAEAHW